MAHLFETLQPIVYKEGKVYFLDQTALPVETRWLEIDSVETCRDAIRQLVVRGAPAIGIGAAFGMLVASEQCRTENTDVYREQMQKALQELKTSRPTAVNLFWALNRIENKISELHGASVCSIKAALKAEVLKIQEEDAAICRKIGEHGQALLQEGMTILTHCNAGALATGKYGTALAPIYVAKERGLDIKVFVDETRPLLQGARLTAYELLESGIDATLITDSMAAAVMAKGWIGACFVGCDRVAANGDTANKIGTYGVALAAKAHQIPFYVACPLSTIDRQTASGDAILIEERDPLEIIAGLGKQTAPLGIKTYNPAFDVTPHEFVTAIITEKGIIRPPYSLAIQKLFS